jgi:transcriptional regulator with XRE-family HTH domain
MSSPNFGKTIKDIRIKKGLKGKYVAEMVNISASTLSKYESGARKVPAEILAPLAAVFEVEVDLFFNKKIGISPIN